MIKKLTILFLFVCWVGSAQKPIPLTVDDGLPSNHVYDVLEDNDGFIWFATNRGVSRYNGETFKNFTIKDGLQNNDIWLLEKDHRNRIWFISKSKYQSYFENDSIHKVKTSNNKVIAPYVVSSKLETYFAFQSFYKLENNVLKEYPRHDSIQSRKLYFKKRGYTHLNDDFISKNSLTLDENQIRLFNNKHEEVSNFRLSVPIKPLVACFEVLGEKSIFLIFSENGILLTDGKDNYKFHPFKTYQYKTILDKLYYKINDNILQITIDNQLLRFDTDYNLIETIELPKENNATRAYKDSHGNLWTVSSNKGVYLINNTQKSSAYFLENKATKRIGNIGNQLHVGTNQDGIYKLENNKARRLSNLNKKKQNIYQIKNNMIVSSYDLYSFSKNDITPLKYEYFQDETLNYKDVIFKNDSTYLITNAGFSKLSKQSNIVSYIDRKIGLIELETFKNRIYLGGSDGLSVLQNDSIVKPSIKHEILQTNINYIQKEGNYLYVATDGQGVYLYNEEEVIPLKNTSDLFVQKVVKQNEDLWLATQNGVLKVTLNNNNLEASKITDRFVESDGLLQTNTNDIFIVGDTLYAASDLGLAKLNVNNPIYKQQPNIYFNTKSDTLVYKNGARDNISISFAALDFKNQQNIKYKYKLEPTRTDWTITNTKTLNFSNLSPNLYELKVLARDQHFNTTVVKQYLKIIPKWWQTIYAKIGFVILGLSSFVIMYFVLKKQIKKREYERTEREKRTAGLELQALRSQMNPHFVHNSLNAIQYFIQRNEVEFSENYLSKFSKLIRLFFEYSREQNITIAQEIELLQLYLDIEKLRFEDKLNYDIYVSDEFETEEQTIPSMLLQPIVENALNHGLFHKKENGYIKITFKYIDETTFKVSVLDDGIGINKAKEIFKTSTKNYNSNSSAVLKERLDLLNKTDAISIDYSIQDCSEIDPKTTGTLVNLTFKTN
ncbi:histidine kinase [Winogradskyella litorisediminis]|uniref:Histidine kinase n=1 Tax=Winogradskyella litorisediminis TaxID=1156618 RepID=A0ABW3N4S7_9FLAO